MSSASAESDPGPAVVTLQPTRADPLASLEISGLTVSFLGRDWAVPALNAAAWLKLIWDEQLDPEVVFPGLCGPGAVDAVDAALLDGSLDLVELHQVCLEVIGEVAGRPWWFVLKLLAVARHAWDRLGGRLALARVDATVMPLGAWIDALYVVVMDHCKPEMANQVVSELMTPPPGYVVGIDEEEEARAFMALAAQGV